MNLNVYNNKEADITALKIARREAEAALSVVDQLELAVEFGRCLKCKAALDTMTTILCDDCNDEMDNPKPEMRISDYPRPGIFVREGGLPGTSGPGPHLTGESSIEPTNEQKYKDLAKRIKKFNKMVDDGKITLLVHARHINKDYMTSFDIDRLWEYLPTE
jgi:hypothetical protein